MINLLSVFVGGGIGSVLRWLCSTVISSHWGTFIVNVVGAFCIGMAYTYFQKHTGLSITAKTFIMTGLLGGFTTFSTFALESADLMKAGHTGTALLYVLLSVLVGVAVIFVVEYVTMK